MQILPVDLTSLVAVILGISIVLVPVIGLTARFALKPTVEALSRFFEGKGRDEALALLERRCALLESQLEAMEADLHRLKEGAEFERQLAGGGTAHPPLSSGSAPRPTQG